MGCKGSRVRIPPRRPEPEQAGRILRVRPASSFGSCLYNAASMATVVFADLVGSTGIFERLGDETAGRFVTQLTTALSKTFEEHSGRVVKLLGDGIFTVFQTESDAIDACIAIQTRLKEMPVYPGGD